MRRQRMKRYIAPFLAILVLTLFGFLAASSQAQDPTALLREAGKVLRQAERDMFSGKNEKSIHALEKIRELISKAKQANPNHPRLKGTERKYTKLVKDLERKTGKDLGGGSLTVVTTGTPTKLPPKPEAKPTPSRAATGKKEPRASSTKLPYAARQPIGQAQQALRSVESSLVRMTDPKWADSRESVVKNLDVKFQYAQKMLKEAKSQAAKKGVTSHPEFDKLEAALGDAEKKIAEAKGAHAKAKTQAAAQAKEVTADVQALKAEYDRVDPVFSKATGTAIYYNDLKPVTELLARIESFEKSELPNIKPKLAAFGKKYGVTREAIDKKADSMGYTGQGRASFAYTQIVEGIENVKKTRVVMADDLVHRAKERMKRSKSMQHDFSRIATQKSISQYGHLAKQFDPDNPRVKEFLAGLDGWIKKDTESLNAKVDKAQWPSQADSAPKNAAQLKTVAMAFLQKEADKSAAKRGDKRKVLGVTITGPWRVFKKNILGEPTQYGLPVVSAVQLESEKGANVARVYQLSLLTQEMKGVKTAPPFIGAAVGNSYYIRPSKVKD